MQLVQETKDNKAFKELVKRYSEKLYRIAFRLTLNKNDAEDMVQDAFFKAWSKRSLWLNKTDSKFSSWICKILVNNCYDYKKKIKKTHEYEENMKQDSVSEVKVQNKIDLDLISKSVSTLAQNQQLALVLCFYEGYSIAEAANIMDCSYKSLESVLYRAKKTLKEALKETET
jgi:RNA polymerase sigma-70 factor (ECF subfamily)